MRLMRPGRLALVLLLACGESAPPLDAQGDGDGDPNGGALRAECDDPDTSWIWCDDFEADRLATYFEYDAADIGPAEPGIPLNVGAEDAAGLTADASFSVTVVDDEPPGITAPADLTDVPTDRGLCSATGVALGAPAVSDNCGVGSPSSDAPSEFPKGTTIVTWTVTDSSGNSTTATQSVTVQDHEPPVLTMPDEVVRGAEPGAGHPWVVRDGDAVSAEMRMRRPGPWTRRGCGPRSPA